MTRVVYVLWSVLAMNGHIDARPGASYVSLSDCQRMADDFAEMERTRPNPDDSQMTFFCAAYRNPR